MNEERLAVLIEHWEPNGCEVVRVIDSEDHEVERIIKFDTGETVWYSLFRYFELGVHVTEDGKVASDRTEVSIDLQDVSADRVIQHLAERL